MRFAVCRCLRWLVRSSSKNPIDDSRERTQLWPPRRRASAIPWRHRERQHLTDRLAVYTKHPRGLAGAHPLDMTRPPNPCVQLHPIHPPRLPVRATLTEGYTGSHFGPPQPDRPAASVGDYCSAVLRRADAINRRDTRSGTGREGAPRSIRWRRYLGGNARRDLSPEYTLPHPSVDHVGRHRRC